MGEKNPLIELNRPYMELIWKRVPKTLKNGVEYIVYEGDDIPALYESGLVDTERYSFKQWEKAFEECRGEFGRYWVNHEKLISLGVFRFSKLVAEPFDPFKMRTGKYSIERMWQLFDKVIIPSCSLPRVDMEQIFNALFRKKQSVGEAFEKKVAALKAQGTDIEEMGSQAVPFKQDESGEFFLEITELDLENFKVLLDTYPSPRRKLELGVQKLRQEKLESLAKRATETQKSSFEEGKDFRKTTQEDLQKMLVKTQTNAAAGREPMDEALDLKSLQKKNRFKGKV